jgi:tetratricopeptide (TPR) repeat protein
MGPNFLFLFALYAFCVPLPAFAAVETITHTVRQTFGGSQSADDARTAAIAKAKREALERSGTYLETMSVVQDGRLSKDETLALASGVLKTKVISQKNYVAGEAFGIEVVVQIQVDTSVLDTRVRKLLNDREHLGKLNASRKRELKLLERIAELEAKDRSASGSGIAKTRPLRNAFRQATADLNAVELNFKTLVLWKDGYYSDPRQAITHLDKAIRLSPNYTEAINNRGNAYNDLGEYRQAIMNFDRAIQLKPDYADALYNRGRSYIKLSEYRRAIADLDRAIQLNPNLARAYNNRGWAYYNFSEYRRAIADLDRAIQLDPNLALAYINRGATFARLGEPRRTIADSNRAIQINPNLAQAYVNRGSAFSLLGNVSQVCQDARKGCSLGNCRLLELARSNNMCR